MQFTLNTAKARPSFVDARVIVKPIISVTLDLSTVQPVPANVKEAMESLRIASDRKSELLAEAEVESVVAFFEVATATQVDAMELNNSRVIAAERIIRPTVNAAGIALALQGVGKYAPFMTKVLKRALRGAWLLDDAEEA